MVAGDQIVCLPCNGELQERQIERITANGGPGRFGDAHGDAEEDSRPAVPVVFVVELEFRVGQRADQLGYGSLGDQRHAVCALPGMAQGHKPALREYQGRKHQVRVQHHPWRAVIFVLRALTLACGCRAHATASAMSCSFKSSSASSREARRHAGCERGENDLAIPGLHVEISGSPSALVTLLGRVSWFLAVILASMASPNKK